MTTILVIFGALALVVVLALVAAELDTRRLERRR